MSVHGEIEYYFIFRYQFKKKGSPCLTPAHASSTGAAKRANLPSTLYGPQERRVAAGSGVPTWLRDRSCPNEVMRSVPGSNVGYWGIRLGANANNCSRPGGRPSVHYMARVLFVLGPAQRRGQVRATPIQLSKLSTYSSQLEH